MPQEQVHEAANAGESAVQRTPRPPIRGFLLPYIVLFVYLLGHGAALTVASLVIYGRPAAAGAHASVSLGYLLFYVITNIALIAYGIYILALIALRRKSAIAHNIAFNVLSVLFLVAWHFLGEKSNVGTLVDSLPGLVGAAYFLRSRRVRATFIARP